MDSVEIKLGQFVFKGDLGQLCASSSISIGPADQMAGNITQLYIEPGTLTVIYDKNKLQKPMRTRGSKTQAELEQFYQDVNYDRFTELSKQYYASNNRDSISKLMQPLQEKYAKKSTEFIKTHPASYLTPYFLMSMINEMNYDELKKNCDSLDPKVKIMPEYKEVERELNTRSRLQPGMSAPLFAKKDVVTGKMVDLKKFRGKYVVLDFWATWCVHCRASNPHMKQLYNKYHKKGLEFIYIADDDNNVAKLKTAIRKDGIGMMHHILRGLKIINPQTYEADHTNDISDFYGISYLPTKYLIGPDGNIIGKFESDELDRKLQELLK